MTDEQVQPKTVWGHAKSLAWLWRHLASYGGIIVGTWMFAGPFIDAQAQEVLKKMLLENPAFKELTKESDQQGADIKKIQDELKAMQNTLDDVSDNSLQTKRDITEIKGDVNALVQALINRRSSIEDIPPFPGPVQP